MRNKLNESDIRRILKRLDQIEESLKAIRRLLEGPDCPSDSTSAGQLANEHESYKVPLVAGNTNELFMLKGYKIAIEKQMKVKSHNRRKNAKRKLL